MKKRKLKYCSCLYDNKGNLVSDLMLQCDGKECLDLAIYYHAGLNLYLCQECDKKLTYKLK